MRVGAGQNVCFIVAWTALLTITPIVGQASLSTPTWSHPTWARNVTNRRTNLCSIQADVTEGRRELRDALNGLELSTVFALAPFMAELNEQGALTNDGICVEIANEVAMRAGFTWRNSYLATPQPGMNESFTEFYLYYAQRYDVVADWGMCT